MKVSLPRFLDKRKVLDCVCERIKDFRKEKKDFAPFSIEIHPTSLCNLSCLHCSYKYRNRQKNTIPQETLDKFLDELIEMGIRAVYFSGGGEPLMVREIFDSVKKLTDNGVEVALLSNGQLIERKNFPILRRLNYLAISLPSVNKNTYSKITGNNELEKILAIPGSLKNNSRGPIVGLRTVITDQNYEEIFEIVNTARYKKFDYIFFKIARDYEKRGLGLSKDAFNILKSKIRQAKDDIDKNFTNLTDICETKSNDALSASRCWTIDFKILCNIHTNGEVYPCLPLIGQKQYCIGNINEAPFKKIWNSRRHQEVIRKLQKDFKGNKCKNCRAIGYNEWIERFMQLIPEEEDVFL